MCLETRARVSRDFDKPSHHPCAQVKQLQPFASGFFRDDSLLSEETERSKQMKQQCPRADGYTVINHRGAWVFGF